MEQTNPPKPDLTVREAAALVGVREFAIRTAINSGELPFTQRIVVAAADVKAWAETAEAKS